MIIDSYFNVSLQIKLNKKYLYQSRKFIFFTDSDYKDFSNYILI